MSLKQDAQRETLLLSLRTVLAITLPPLAAVVVSLLASIFLNISAFSEQAFVALLLGPVGLASWLLGLRWYGLHGLGLRGGRPLFAGIGFAVLGWIVVLVARFVFVQGASIGQPDATRTFVYFLLFEAFCLQLWTFGLLFRAIAGWRGALTAAFGSGLVFGFIADLALQESFGAGPLSFMFFVIWGLFYGIIRLRTGSLLGTVVVQAIQSFTTWVVINPFVQPDAGQLRNFYLVATIGLLILIWRLWPKEETDYRV
jgi:hypothetical protein